jgi:hypothetical protein
MLYIRDAPASGNSINFGTKTEMNYLSLSGLSQREKIKRWNLTINEKIDDEILSSIITRKLDIIPGKWMSSEPESNYFLITCFNHFFF